MVKLLYTAVLSIGLMAASFAYPVNDPAEIEEIVVLLYVPEIGYFNIGAVYSEKKQYLSVTELFQYLRINQELTLQQDHVKGFFLEESNVYEIDYPNRKIILAGKTWDLEESEMIKTETDLYLSFKTLSQIFELILDFDLQTLKVSLSTAHELPQVNEQKRKEQEEGLQYQGQTIRIDRIIDRERHLLEGATFDWGISATLSENQGRQYAGYLGSGVELFGGEAIARVQYNNSLPNPLQQQYNWRKIWENNPVVQQVNIGHISGNLIAPTFGRAIGIDVSNTPMSTRQSFGTYILADQIEKDWDVHLYINSVLTEFQKTDESGNYRFEIPLIYGTSDIELKLYGPYGEERVVYRHINVPQHFIPKGKFEYQLQSGVFQENLSDHFSKARLAYGLNKNITVGTSLEYLKKEGTALWLPTLSASARFKQYFTYSQSYTHGVFSESVLNYNLPSKLSLQLSYEQYADGQNILPSKSGKYLDFSVFKPYQVIGHKGYIRAKHTIVYQNRTAIQSNNLSFLNFFKSFDTRINLRTGWFDQKLQTAVLETGLGWKIGRKLKYRVQSNYDLQTHQLTNVNMQLNQRTAKFGQLSLIYSNNFSGNRGLLTASISFNLGTAKGAISSSLQENQQIITANASGSLITDFKSGSVRLSSEAGVGKAGLTLIPFLDINHNGFRDEAEPLVKKVGVVIKGARHLSKSLSGVTRATGLEAYNDYVIHLDDGNLEDISWRLKTKNIKAYTDPNQSKNIYVPIYPMNECSGTVVLETEGESKGIGRAKINFQNTTTGETTQIESNADGSYLATNLGPGYYLITIDREQQQSLGITASPYLRTLEIPEQIYGEYYEQYDFILKKEINYVSREDE